MLLQLHDPAAARHAGVQGRTPRGPAWFRCHGGAEPPWPSHPPPLGGVPARPCHFHSWMRRNPLFALMSGPLAALLAFGVDRRAGGQQAVRRQPSCRPVAQPQHCRLAWAGHLSPLSYSWTGLRNPGEVLFYGLAADLKLTPIIKPTGVQLNGGVPLRLAGDNTRSAGKPHPAGLSLKQRSKLLGAPRRNLPATSRSKHGLWEQQEFGLC